MNTAKVALITVGVVSIGMAAVGLWYNLTTVSTDFSDFLQEKDYPHFYPAFYTMSAICIACYVALLTCGIQFVRLRTRFLSLFIGIIIFEVVYFFFIATMWLVPEIGTSIAAATGVANGGLMFQVFILFPLWGPLLAGWASHHLARTERLSIQTPHMTS